MHRKVVIYVCHCGKKPRNTINDRHETSLIGKGDNAISLEIRHDMRTFNGVVIGSVIIRDVQQIAGVPGGP